MKAAVVLVGDELLSGHTRDANAHYIAQRLHALGHRLRRVGVVPDELPAIANEVDVTMPQASVIFVCGGLGPTHDDRTTEALAKRFHRELVVDEPSWERLRERYLARGSGPLSQTTVESARKMVTVPEGVEILDNPVGAACGYVLREESCAIVVLPGVPAELQAIFEQHVVGKIVPPAQKPSVVEADLEMAEAAFAHALGLVAERYADVEIGSYPHFGERRVTLRFRGEGPRAHAALEAFLDAVPEARARLLKGP